MFIRGNYFLKNISQNPYRILGVTANTPKKDIIANVNKFKAFLKVGKHISGPFDSIPGIGQVERTIETIESAEKALELPIDQLRWSMFWFVNKTPIDKIALNHVQSGNIDKAIDIWSKVESVSSLINLTVSELIRQNWAEATLHADKLFAAYTNSICSLVDDTLSLTQAQLIRLFMDSIAEDNYGVLRAMYRAFPKVYNFYELVKDGECRYLSKPDGIDLTMGIPYPSLEIKKRACTAYYRFLEGNELTESQFNARKESLIFVEAPFDSVYKRQSIYEKEAVVIPSKIWNKIICETLAVPYIEKAKAEIASYRAIPTDKTEERYKFAKSMLLHYLPEIYGYLGGDSSEYITLNNQIVKESLKCAIDYYNNAQNPDEIARDVKKFVWDITTTAIPESILRQRCKENYDILCEICSKLPPESIAYYHKLLKILIDKYRTEATTIQNASAFVNKCFPYLMSIKSVLGASNAYFQRMCTL